MGASSRRINNNFFQSGHQLVDDGDVGCQIKSHLGTILCLIVALLHESGSDFNLVKTILQFLSLEAVVPEVDQTEEGTFKVIHNKFGDFLLAEFSEHFKVVAKILIGSVSPFPRLLAGVDNFHQIHTDHRWCSSRIHLVIAQLCV